MYAELICWVVTLVRCKMSKNSSCTARYAGNALEFRGRFVHWPTPGQSCLMEAWQRNGTAPVKLNAVSGTVQDRTLESRAEALGAWVDRPHHVSVYISFSDVR